MPRILVVDDNRANLDLMLYLLRAFGHDAQGFLDAPSALAAARSGAYDIVLSDVLMPGMDGYQLARTLREEAVPAGVPLIAVTALAMPGDRDRIVAAGFDGYIAKPIDPQSFVSQVEAYLSPA